MLKNKKETKVIILDNNPLSIAMYFDEFPEMEKRFKKMKQKGEYVEGDLK